MAFRDFLLFYIACSVSTYYIDNLLNRVYDYRRTLWRDRIVCLRQRLAVRLPQTTPLLRPLTPEVLLRPAAAPPLPFCVPPVPVYPPISRHNAFPAGSYCVSVCSLAHLQIICALVLHLHIFAQTESKPYRIAASQACSRGLALRPRWGAGGHTSFRWTAGSS